MTNDSAGLSAELMAALRVQYVQAPFDEAHLAATPLAQFHTWFQQAVDVGITEPNAMSLSTVTTSGQPSSRHVLLKEADPRGFIFYTNLQSRKAREIAANPQVALLFPWLRMYRQIHVQGIAEQVGREEALNYFRTRPWGSQIGAWASTQSAVLADRQLLETRTAEIAARYPEGSEVPLPDHWGGYLVRAKVVEFWAGRESRLHDRLQFISASGQPADLDQPANWQVQRLYP